MEEVVGRSPPPLPKVLLSLLPLPPENPRLGPKGPSFGPKVAPIRTGLPWRSHASIQNSSVCAARGAGMTRQTINSIEKGRFHPSRRQVPILPLQRNEIVTESCIGQIIERARQCFAYFCCW